MAMNLRIEEVRLHTYLYTLPDAVRGSTFLTVGSAEHTVPLRAP